jgi:predicted nucleic acid-binding protein
VKPSSRTAEGQITLIDTSAAVAFIVSDHAAHSSTWAALADRTLGMSGHAWFETFSVLTRLPGPSRRDARTVSRLISSNFPESRVLDEQSTASHTANLAESGISGGAVYDALVAAAAVHHALPLVSRDRRALDTYRSIGLDVEFLT